MKSLLPIQIVPYTDVHAAAFRALNLEWLHEHQLTETHDLEMLDEPRKKILEEGNGHIFIALSGDEVIGTAALICHEAKRVELAKFSVAAQYRGKGIGRLLLDRCLQKAKELRASSVYLYSSSKLKAAVALYEQYGFRHLALEDMPYETADIKMELRCKIPITQIPNQNSRINSGSWRLVFLHQRCVGCRKEAYFSYTRLMRSPNSCSP